jgi:hypothetical protein
MQMTQKMKRVGTYYRRMIVFAVLLMAAMAWDTYAARAQYQPVDGWIIVLQFNRCLDADANGGGNGTTVQLWDCWGGQNQNWIMLEDNSIYNSQFDTKCLDADNSYGGGNGTKVQLWDCNGQPNQKWNFTLDGNLVNQQFSSQCLDADNTYYGGNGTKVQIWGCWNGPNQKWWATTQVAEPIQVRGFGGCLDADTNTIGENGTVVQLWDCWGGANQLWNMLSDGTIMNLQSHRCLDADAPTINVNGTKVQLWDCNGGPNQKWNWPGYGYGTSVLGSANRNAQSYRCLDADAGGGGNGTKVQLWDCWGGINQFWLNPGMASTYFPNWQH